VSFFTIKVEHNKERVLGKSLVNVVSLKSKRDHHRYITDHSINWKISAENLKSSTTYWRVS